jgi:hypothetical protein
MIRSTLLTLALFTAVACGTTTRFTPTNPSPRPMGPRAPETVHIYTSQPQTPYVEVGILQSRQSSELSSDDMPEIVQSMRKEAAKIGCDGVIINGTADKVVSDQVISGGHSSTTLEGFWGACIMYSAPGPVAAQ